MDDDEEKCLGATKPSSSKKRAIAAPPMDSLQQVSVTKKRVALGDLTNIPDADRLSSTHTQRNPDRKPNSQFITTSLAVEETVISEIDLLGIPSDDSEKCADTPLIYHHLRSLEVEESRRPLHDYMEKVQKEITPAMREILVDWLVEVADEFKLVSDTLYLTVNYIDRYLSSHTMTKTKLQLLGVCSMLVASKFEEIIPPHVEDCCYMTDNAYTREEVVAMESNVLKFLNYNTSNPTSKSFLRIFTKAAQVNSAFSNMQFEFLASYIAELSLTDYACVKFLPSMVAASAIFLARFTILPTIYPWSLALQRYTGYTASELKECVLAIHDLLLKKGGASVHAVKDKYTQHKYKCVAALRPESEIPRQYFEVATGELVSQEAKFWDCIKNSSISHN